MPYLYHVTPRAKVKRILKSGLKTRRGEGLTTSGKYRKRVYFFTNIDIAREFLNDCMETEDSKDWTILKVWVPKGSRLYRDIEMRGDPKEDEAKYILGTVPPKDIVPVQTAVTKVFEDGPLYVPGVPTKEDIKKLKVEYRTAEDPRDFEGKYSRNWLRT